MDNRYIDFLLGLILLQFVDYTVIAFDYQFYHFMILYLRQGHNYDSVKA